MIRLFPPVAKINQSEGAFTFQKPPGQAGSFRLSAGSLDTLASVNASTGEVTFTGSGTVSVELVLNGAVLASSELQILNSVDIVDSHLTVYGSDISFLGLNELAKDGEVFLYPQIVRSTGEVDSSQGNLQEYDILLSTDGQVYYSVFNGGLVLYSDYVDVLTVERYQNTGLNLGGFKVTCQHGSLTDVFVKVKKGNFEQIYIFALNGPSEIAYSPFYRDTGFEIDLGTSITIDANVVSNPEGTPIVPALHTNQSPDILDITPLGIVTPKRATFTEYPSYATFKNNLWSFLKTEKGDVFATVANQFYSFSATGGFTQPSFFTGNAAFNFRQLSDIQGEILVSFASEKLDDAEGRPTVPHSIVVGLTLSNNLMYTIAEVNEVATACTVVQKPELPNSRFCLLASVTVNLVNPSYSYEELTQYGLTNLYLFPATESNRALGVPSAQFAGIIRKILPGPAGWAYLQSNNGAMYLYQMGTANIQQISLANPVQTFSVEENGTVFWAYSNVLGKVLLRKYALEFLNNNTSFIVADSFDFGELNTKPEASYILRADVVDGIHYLVFSTYLPDNKFFADILPNTQEVQNSITERLGILDLTQDVIGQVKFYSEVDPSVTTVVDFKVLPQGTKHAYFLYYTGNVLNLPTKTQNLLPVTVGYSDGTFSYNTDSSLISQTEGATLEFLTGTKVLYAKSETETQGSITFKTSDSITLSRTLDIGFYHVPTDAGIGSPGSPLTSVSVKTGASVSVPTFITVEGGGSYPHKLTIEKSGNSTTYGWSGNYLLITGVNVGIDTYSYRTPQPLPYPISGNFFAIATGIPVPSYIRFTNIQNSAFSVDYRPEPFFKKYSFSVSGEVVYSDDTVKDNDLNWTLASGTDVLEISGNTITVKSGATLPVASELKGILRAASKTKPSVQKTALIYIQASDDKVISEIFFPDYITKFDNFVKLNTLPQNTLPVLLRQSDGNFLYGNSLVNFSVVNSETASLTHTTNGVFSPKTGSYGNNTIKVVYNRGDGFPPLTGTVTIQVAGPERIESLLPYYKVDFGSKLSYATGTIYDVAGEVFTAKTISKASDNTYEFDNNPSGILRGSVVPYISGLANPITKARTTEENTLSTLDSSGRLTYYDQYKIAKFSALVKFENKTATVFDLPRPDRGVLVFNSGANSMLYRMNNASAFSKWGALSGTVLDVAVIGDRVFFTRKSGTSYSLGSLSRNSLPPAAGLTLDYAVSLNTGITAPHSLTRDGSLVICTTTGGSVFAIYDDATRQNLNYQIFSGSRLASSQFNITTGNLVQNANLQAIGKLTNLSGISAGYSFYLTDNTRKDVWLYQPAAVNQSKLSFYVEGFSRQTRLQVPVEVLPSGTTLDYFGTLSAPSTSVPYLNDSFSLDLKVYNSNGQVYSGNPTLSKVDLFLNGRQLTELSGTYTQGGLNQFTAVSKTNPDLQFSYPVTVRRKVKSISIDNFTEDDVVSVNADSVVPLEAWVVYEDGYKDKALTATVTQHSDSVSAYLLGDELYISGISVTRTNATVALSAVETNTVSEGIRTKEVSVAVLPIGTRKLSRLSVPSSVSFSEQSTQSAGVSLVFTDGYITPLYDEGFQNSFDGVQTFDDLIDLTVSEDIVYVLRKSTVDLYDGRGVILKSIGFTQPLQADSLSKIRVDGQDIYVGNKYIIYAMDSLGETQEKYGSYDSASTAVIQDFSVQSGIIYIAKVSSTEPAKSQFITKGAQEVSVDLQTNDVKRFVRLANGSVYFLTTTSIVATSGSVLVSGLSNVNSIASFDNLIYLTTNHRIARIGLNGQITYLVGSVFSGFANGSATVSRFNTPTALALDSRQRVFVIDSLNKTLRRLFESSVSTLIGGFWTSTDSNVAIGQGPSLILKNPGVTDLKVKYLNVEKSIKVTSQPVYTSVQVSITDNKIYLGSSSKKSSIDLKASVYSLSGLATGTRIDAIDYPPLLTWQCNPPNYLVVTDSTAKFKPESDATIGTYEIKVLLSGNTSISNTSIVEILPWEVTSMAFKSGSYFTKTYDNLNLGDQLEKVYNDGEKGAVASTEVTFSGTTNGSTLTTGSEYRGTVVATTKATPIFTAQAQVYVYDKDLAFEFTTTPVTISAGFSRNLSGKHVITGTVTQPSIFQNEFITYALSPSLSNYAMVASNGVVSAFESTTEGSGTLTGTSLLLDTSTARGVSTSTGAVWSEFTITTADVNILHSGSYIKLEDIKLSAVDSQKQTTAISLNLQNTALFDPSGINAKLELKDFPVTASTVSKPVISYVNQTGSNSFSAIYTHSLDATPLSQEVRTYGIPFLAVQPLGLEIKHGQWYAINTYKDSIPVPTLFVVAENTKEYQISLVYNDSYKDNKYTISSTSNKFTITPLVSGSYRISGASIADTTQSWVEDTFKVVYDYGNKVSFPVRVVVSRDPLVEAITIKETDNSIIIGELVKFTYLTPEVRLTDLSVVDTGYTWWINDTDTNKTVVLQLSSLNDGDIFYARSKGTGFEGQFVYSSTFVFYRTVEASTASGSNPSSDPVTQQAISENNYVEFVPKLNVKLDLDKVLPISGCIEAKSWSVSNPSAPTFIPNADFMIDSNNKAIFSRKTAIIATGSNILASFKESSLRKVTENGTSALVREPDRILKISTPVPPLAISLKDGYLVYSEIYSGSLHAFGDTQESPYSQRLTNVLTSLSWISGNEAIGNTSDTPKLLFKFVVDFTDGSIEIQELGAAPGNNFTSVFTTPAGSLRYLSSGTEILINQNNTLVTAYGKDITAAMAISESQYIASKERKVWLLNDATDTEIYLGEISSSFGNILQIERIDDGHVLLRTQTHLLKVSTSDNKTLYTIQHTKNPNIKDSLSVEILPTGSSTPYAISFVPSQLSVEYGASFTVTGKEFNSSGTCTDITSLTHDTEFLTQTNGSYTASKHGSTFITGSSASLTGTVQVTVTPVVTGIEVSSPFFLDPATSTVFTAGSYIPYKIVGVLSDGSYTNRVKINNASIIYDADNELIYAEKELANSSVEASSLDKPDIKKQISITVLASGTVQTTRMDIESGPFALTVGEQKFISGTVFYTNGTSDRYISTTFATSNQAPYPANIVDSNILNATGIGIGSVDIVPMVKQHISSSTALKETRDFTVVATYGKVVPIRDSSTKIITGFKIENTSGLSGVFFDFTTKNPTLIQTSPTTPCFDVIDVVVSGTEATLKLKSRKAAEGQNVTLKVLLEGYTLTDSEITLTVPDAIPELKFELDNYFLTADSTVKTAIKASLVYDTLTSEEVKLGDILSSELGSIIKKDGSGNWYFEFGESTQTLSSGTITGTVSGYSAVASVFINQGAPYGIAFFSGGNRITQVSTNPYVGTAITGHIVDNTLTPLVNVGQTVSPVTLIPSTGITVVTDNSSTNTYPFTVSSSTSGTLTSQSSVGGVPFSTSLTVLHSPTRVSKVEMSLSVANQQSAPYKVFVGKPFDVSSVKVYYYFDPSNSAEESTIRAPYINLDFVNGPAALGVFESSFLDLFDVYLGNDKLTSSQIRVTPNPLNSYPTFTFLQAITTTAQPFYIKLKGTELTSSKAITIILQELPYTLEISNPDLDRYRIE